MTAKLNAQGLPIKVAIVDGDAAAAKIAERALIALGVNQCDIFSNGNEGYDAIKRGEYGAVIVDWKIGGDTSGLAILSRLRRIKETVYLPVILTTSQLKQDEMRGLQDFQCMSAILKPVHQRDIQKAITSLVQEEKWYFQSEKSVIDALNRAQLDSSFAVKSVQGILAKSPNPFPLAMIAAKHFMLHKCLQEAGELYDSILQRDSAYLPALSGKARLLSIQGKQKNAMALLQKAYSLAPKNIDRLSLMGEVEISLRNPEAAIQYFQKALGLDAHDWRAKIGITVAKEFNQLVSLQNSAANAEPSIAKIINNLGVQLAHSGEFEKALKYYLVSFSFLADNDLQSKVSFNMGICFKKWNKLPQAKFWLEQSIEKSSHGFNKAVRQLVGLEQIVAKSGLDEKKTRVVASVAAATPTPKIKKVLPVTIIPPPQGPLSETYLEEETVDIHGLGGNHIKGINLAIDKLIDNIDDSFADLDEEIAFDDAV